MRKLWMIFPVLLLLFGCAPEKQQPQAVPGDKISKDEAASLIQTDLSLELFFNGASFAENALEDAAYAPYFLADDSLFASVSDIETTVQNTYAEKSHMDNYLSLLNGETPLYKEIDGKLYGNGDIGGKGLPLLINTDDIVLADATDKEATILCPYTVEIDGLENGTLKIPVVKQDGIWKLKKSVYECWNP